MNENLANIFRKALFCAESNNVLTDSEVDAALQYIASEVEEES